MPRAVHLIRGTVLAVLVAGGAAAQDCTPSLAVDMDGAETRMTYAAPCAPYAAVTVIHGPLVFGEQTGRDGALSLDLPALPGGGTLAVSLDGTVTRAELPAPAGRVPDLAAVIWPDAPPPDLPGARAAGSGPETGPETSHGAAPRRLGFPGERPQVDVLPAGATTLDLPVTPATCGQDIAARVVTGTQVSDLRVTLPDCDGPGGALRIPLAP